MIDVKLYGSATVEECELAHKIALTGIDELLDASPSHVSRAKVRILAAIMRDDIAQELLNA